LSNPRTVDKDPFDRIVIWHCITIDAILVSYDGKFEDYESNGLKVLRWSRLNPDYAIES